MTSATLTPTQEEVRIPAPELRGNNFALGACTDTEVCLEGPAGTGKTFAALYKIHCLLQDYPGAKALVTRKTNTALAASAMVTYRENVIHPAENIRYFGGNRVKPPGFQYPNGSFLAVTGLDKPEKVQSAEYDICFVNETTECEERDIDYLRIRMRKGILPYQQIIMDVNPDVPTHWLNVRMDAGRTTRLVTTHKDNPRYWDSVTNDWTEEGRRYVLGILAGLTGILYDRFVLGLWVAAEGMVYRDSWNRERIMIARAPIPKEWPRYLGIDFGYSHPFVCLWCAVAPDGRLVIYRQIYRTRRLVEDHALDIALASGWFHLLPPKHPKYAQTPAEWADPIPREIICDHAAEDRATLERKLRMLTMAAKKTISDGIQATSARMRPAGDGKPGLQIMRNCLLEVDPDLVARKKPKCVEEEFPLYIWKKGADQSEKEEPVDENNHGMDVIRYLVARFDLVGGVGVSYFRDIWT